MLLKLLKVFELSFGTVLEIIRQCTNEMLSRQILIRHLSHYISRSKMQITAEINGKILVVTRFRTGKAMQKTEIPVMPIERASGRFESNQPDMTASFELMDTILNGFVANDTELVFSE